MLLAVVLLGAVPSLVLAEAADEMPSSSSEAVSPPESLAEPDPASSYARSLKLRGAVMMASGVGIAAGSIFSAIAEFAVRRDESRLAPYLVAVGVPTGATLVVTALPAMLLGPRYLRWYEAKGPAPGAVARWKLMQRWQADLLRAQRDGGFIAAGVLAGAATLATMSWLVHDLRGSNGNFPKSYDPSDLVTASSLWGSAAMTALGGGLAAARLGRHRRASPSKAVQQDPATTRLHHGALPAPRLYAALAPLVSKPGVQSRSRAPLSFHLGLSGTF